MPQLYKYLGILIFFHSNEHEPIHVHGQYQGNEVKAEIIIEQGKIVEIKLKAVKNAPPLSGAILNDFTHFIEVHANEIIEKWVEYFVYHKELKPKVITKRIK